MQKSFMFPLQAAWAALCCAVFAWGAEDASGPNEPSPPPEEARPRVLVAGFEPFGGRERNAGWIAARAFEKEDAALHYIQLPVRWEHPLKKLDAAVGSFEPDAVIIFGEQEERRFSLEVLARDRRWMSVRDSAGNFAVTRRRAPESPEAFMNRLPLYSWAEVLGRKGFPTEVSYDAGGLQCEELYYHLMRRRWREGDDAQTPPVVLLAHVPYLGSSLENSAEGEAICDRAMLERFGATLGQIVLEHLQNTDSGQAK
jgi:pyrrolidone-carboxylate peptidase